MINTLLGTKKEMSQAFIQGGRIPVTKIDAGPCIVTHIKKEDKDGYWAVQIGFGEKKIAKTSKPARGHLKGAISKSKLAPRFLREVKVSADTKLKVGDIISVSDIFSIGDKVAVTGTSKGKGFTGVVKRWKFAGGPRTHGQSDRPRSAGSIGQGTTPGRVRKGKKMAGRKGTDRVTVKGLQVVSIDPKGEIVVSGFVPGPSGGLLMVTKLASGKLEELVKETRQQVVEQKEKVEEESEDKEGKEEMKSGDEKEKGVKEPRSHEI